MAKTPSKVESESLPEDLASPKIIGYSNRPAWLQPGGPVLFIRAVYPDVAEVNRKMLFHALQQAAQERGHTLSLAQLGQIGAFLRKHRDHRFGFLVTSAEARIIMPVELDGDRTPANWASEIGRPGWLVGFHIQQLDHVTGYFYWDFTHGFREVTGEYLLGMLSVPPAARFLPGDVVRVIDPGYECHCAIARGRLCEVVRPASNGLHSLIDVPDYGVIAIDPELLRHEALRGAAA